EHLPYKQRVTGSSPVSSIFYFEFFSLFSITWQKQLRNKSSAAFFFIYSLFLAKISPDPAAA
ncbi:hypothetical protein ACIA38_08890, partial [Lactobacillus delbrueckii subsp. bulgaricus]